MSRCSDRRERAVRAVRVSGTPASITVNERLQPAVRVFSDIAQVVEFNQDCCFNIVSVKNGNICFDCHHVEILEAGTYQIDFSSEDTENIPLVLTVNGCPAQGVVYRSTIELNIGSVIIDLRHGDLVALTNKFSLNNLVMPENVINTIRVANASLYVLRV